MKKWKLAVTVLLAAGLLTGCKGKQPETEPQTEAPTEAMTEAVTEAPTEPETEPEPEDSMNKTRVLKGLVKSSDTSTLTIQTERGKELQFAITGADIQLANGLQAGATVNILYKGRIDDTDTTNAKVQMIRELDAQDTPVTEGEQMTESAEADPNAGSGTMTGSIADVNTERIVILADDGDSYYFSLYETDINLKNGLQENNYVTVNYTGDIYGPELVPADTITDTENVQDRVTAGPTAGGNFSYVNGTVDDCSVSTLTITTDDGDQVTFNTVGATQCFTEGLSSGCYITVEYSGELDGSAAASAVYTYTDAPAADGVQDTPSDTTQDAADGAAQTEAETEAPDAPAAA